MSPTILVGLFIGLPAIALVVLRINATLVFLSLCLGAVLVRFVAEDMSDTIGILAVGTGKTSPQAVSLALLLAPPLVTSLIMLRSVKSPAKKVLNLLPALAVGVLGLLLVEPLLSDSLRMSIESSDAWRMISKLQTSVVGASAIISLFFLWLHRPKSLPKEDKTHK